MFLDTEKQLTLFSNEGKLQQCDNALKAATQGSISVGCKSEDGVVIASLKENTNFVDLTRYRKIYKVSPTIGCTYSGLQPDFRIQYNMAVRIVEDYRDVYRTDISINTFIVTFSREIQEYTIKKGYRPFGTLLLFIGDNKMYRVDPSGSYSSVKVGSIGKDCMEASKLLEKRVGMLDDNISTCVECIREYCGREITSKEVDIGVYFKEKGIFKIMSEEEVKEVFDSISKK